MYAKETLSKNEIRLQIVNLGPEDPLADEDTSHYDYWPGLHECISDYGLEKYAILKDYMLEEDLDYKLSDPHQRFFFSLWICFPIYSLSRFVFPKKHD